jgi:hypothetical protein
MQHQHQPTGVLTPRPLTATSPDVLVLRRLTPEERRELRDRGVCVSVGDVSDGVTDSDDEEI